MQEIFVPEPLTLDNTVVNLQIDNDKINSYTMKNDEKPVVVLEKYNEKTGQLLGGAEFRLEQLDDAWQTEFMLDQTGKKSFTVNPGTYRFTEIAAPDGYLIVTEHKDFETNPNDEIVVKFDNRPRPVLEILKIDEATKKPLPGAKFLVTKTEDKTTGEYITGADGRIVIKGLDEAIYTVEEIISLDGYLLKPQHKDAHLQWGKTTQLVFTNKAKPKLYILKVDAITGEPLPFAEFRVTKVEDKTVLEYITDETGEILIEDLDEAIYKAEEFLPPDGYIRYDESKEIIPRLLAQKPVYIASFAAWRRDSNNPFGSIRFFGICCTGQEAFLIFYADSFGVFYQKELSLFHNFIQATGIEKRAVIFILAASCRCSRRAKCCPSDGCARSENIIII